MNRLLECPPWQILFATVLYTLFFRSLNTNVDSRSHSSYFSVSIIKEPSVCQCRKSQAKKDRKDIDTYVNNHASAEGMSPKT
ncbi:hypothetical protein BH20ACI2_BH20ACI2_22440 [soil metagenome]